MGCHALLQGIFPTQGSNPKPASIISALAGGFFTTSATWEALILKLLTTKDKEEILKAT